VLAGFYDGRADEGPGAGPATLAGLMAAEERGERPDRGGDRGRRTPKHAGSPAGDGAAATGPGALADAARDHGYGRERGPSGDDAPAQTSESDPANPDTPRHGEASER
jgi:NADH-quinone oxidoreductase subunit E